MSSSRECVKCASRPSSILFGFVPLVILMVLSAFSIKGNLNESTRLVLSTHARGDGRVHRTQQQLNPSSSAVQTINAVPSGSHATGMPPPAWSTGPVQMSSRFSREKSIEVFKVGLGRYTLSLALRSVCSVLDRCEFLASNGCGHFYKRRLDGDARWNVPILE